MVGTGFRGEFGASQQMSMPLNLPLGQQMSAPLVSEMALVLALAGQQVA